MTGWEFQVIWDHVVFRFLPYIIVSAIIYLGVVCKFQGKIEVKEKDIRMILLSLAMLFVVVFISTMVDRSGYSNNLGWVVNVFCKLYALICSVFALYMSYYLSYENWMLRERALMEQLLHTTREQQRISTENIELINIKCHDLKHQLANLRELNENESVDRYIKSIEEEVSIYDSVHQTGNKTLDLVLTEKSLICNKYEVKLSCMADGKLLDFMDTTDLYLLFGNLLDNAIESVMQEEINKRIISVKVMKKVQGIYVRIDNYCKETIQFKDGLPITTKEDKKHHGFGMKSIKYLVQKYKGELLVQVEDELFQVDLYFSEEE